MKRIKLLMIALVAMVGFSSCEKENNEYDHSADLVGTWTCLTENFAEALVINADGSLVSTGVADGEYWEEVAGNIVVENGNVTLAFVDGDTYKGHFDIIPGMAFSIYNEEGGRFTFNYCANDLSEEIVGMWVCTDGPTDVDNDMMIRNFSNDGKTTFTGLLPIGDDPESILNYEVNYKVVGNLIFLELPENNAVKYSAERLIYSPNATALGDILTIHRYLPTENGLIESKASFLRIKQSLDLAGKKYDYIKTFVSNVKGLDKDINFMGFEFNFAKMDGTTIDKMLKALLFSVEFPSANKIKYSCRFSSGVQTVEAPIAVDGNKMTLKMSEVYPTAKDIDLYTFQDADCSQMHMYMPTYAFINFFGNMQVIMMSQLGQLDTNNAAAVKAVFDSIDEAVETINVSFVMTKATKAL